jgi:hypothetical protein
VTRKDEEDKVNRGDIEQNQLKTYKRIDWPMTGKDPEARPQNGNPARRRGEDSFRIRDQLEPQLAVNVLLRSRRPAHSSALGDHSHGLSTFKILFAVTTGSSHASSQSRIVHSESPQNVPFMCGFDVVKNVHSVCQWAEQAADFERKTLLWYCVERDDNGRGQRHVERRWNPERKRCC